MNFCLWCFLSMCVCSRIARMVHRILVCVCVRAFGAKNKPELSSSLFVAFRYLLAWTVVEAVLMVFVLFGFVMHVPSLLRQNYIQMWILQTAFWVSTKYQLNFKGNFTIIAYAKKHTQTLTSSPITIVVKQHSESNQQRFPTQNIQQRSESERVSERQTSRNKKRA